MALPLYLSNFEIIKLNTYTDEKNRQLLIKPCQALTKLVKRLTNACHRGLFLKQQFSHDICAILCMY